MILSEIKLTYKRVQLSENQLTNSNKINGFIRDYLQVVDEDITLQEKFFAIFFDVAMKPIGILKAAESGIDCVMIDTRLIYSTAATTGAKTVIIAHNHPSGNMKPSDADRKITKSLQEGLRTLEVYLADHIIISGTDTNYYSFKDNLEI